MEQKPKEDKVDYPAMKNISAIWTTLGGSSGGYEILPPPVVAGARVRLKDSFEDIFTVTSSRRGFDGHTIYIRLDGLSDEYDLADFEEYYG